MKRHIIPRLRVPRWLYPPGFPDEEQTRVAVLLNLFIWTLICLLFINAVVLFFAAPGIDSTLWMNGLLIAVAFGLRWLMYQGRVRLASCLLCLVFWGSLTYYLASSGGLRSPAMVDLGITVVMATILLGGWGAAGFGMISGMTLVALYVGDTTGLLVSLESAPTESRLLATDLSFISAIAVFAAIGAYSVRNALAHTRHSRSQLAEQNQALEREIAERLRLEESQRISEQRFIALAEESPVGIYMTDDAFRFVYANQRLADLMGYPIKEIIGADFRKFIVEQDLDRIVDGYQSRRRGEPAVNPFAVRISRKDGQPRDLEGYTTALTLADGKLYSWGQILDVTERLQAEARILHLNRLYAVLSHINQVIVHVQDADTLYREVCRIAVEYGQFRMVWIGIADDNTGLVKLSHCAGDGDGYFASVRISIRDEPEGRGPTGIAIREDRYDICNDIEHDPRMLPWRAEALKRDYRSSGAFPIHKDNRVIGALGLYGSEANFFDPEIVRLLEEVTSAIAFALDNLDREALRREAEERFATIFHLSPIPITLTTLDEGRCIDVNQATLDLQGYTREEMIGSFILDLHFWVDPEQRGIMVRELRQRGKFAAYEFKYYKKSGEVRDAVLSAELIELHGQRYNLAMFVDITERKRAEDALRKAYDDLEIRVQERTAALAEANASLQAEIATRKQAEANEHEQRILAEALRDTAAALSGTLNVEVALGCILDNIGRVVSHDTSSILLIESGVASIVSCRGYDVPDREQAILALRYTIATTPGLSQIVESGLPLLIPDTQTYPGWSTRTPEEEGLHAYLGAPIRLGTEIMGVLALRAATPGFFGKIHAERLQAFAGQAAVAIQNARLYQKAQELAVLQERQRLARDLHDAVSQTIYSASIVAEMLPRLWQHDLDAAQQGLTQLQQLTRGALAEMRTLLFELRPTALAEAELSDLLRQLAEAAAGRTRLAITLKTEPQPMLPPDAKIALYRIAQEALNNIVKHAQATDVNLSLRHKSRKVELLICDNGRGFDQGHIPPGHLGLTGMRERARAIGATVRITTASGKGTTVRIMWPDATNQGDHND